MNTSEVSPQAQIHRAQEVDKTNCPYPMNTPNPPFPVRCLWACLLLIPLVSGILIAGNSPSTGLSLRRSADEWVVTSQAGATWRVVLATHSPASIKEPGGGVVRALHLPADNPASVVGTEPTHFAFGPWGLDNLEWRYVVKGAKWGTRQALGVDSTIDRIEVVRETPTAIEILIEGHWENVPRFVRRITFDPGGWRVRVEANWDGPDTHYGMWWMWSLFHGAAMDNKNVRIHDADTSPVPLPIFKGNVQRVPEGIDFPYVITFPLEQSPVPSLQLRINAFGGDSKRGPCYELWPEERARKAVDENDTYKTFMPRWVAGRIEQRTYVFDYAWRVDGGATSFPQPNHNTF